MAMKRRLNSAKIEAKVSGSLSGVSGGMSIISAHNVCHTLCIGVVAALTFFGIAVSGMPLMFLQKYTLLFWGMAVSFLALSLALYYFKGPCISKKAMLFNSGLIVAGVPFSMLERFNLIFWIVGGAITLMAVVWYIKDKINAKNKKKRK